MEEFRCECGNLLSYNHNCGWDSMQVEGIIFVYVFCEECGNEYRAKLTMDDFEKVEREEE